MDFNEAHDLVSAFRNERDWNQFHNPKDLAISICLEASELLELFQRSASDCEMSDKRPEMLEELADVMIYCIHLADRLNADIPAIIQDKMAKNAAKYPAELARGSSKKYDQIG